MRIPGHGATLVSPARCAILTSNAEGSFDTVLPMRKWIVVALIAALVIAGVLHLLVSGPRSGSMQYHKEQYLKGNTGVDKWIQNNAPGVVTAFWFSRKVEHASFHYDALIKLGYFEEREFVLSNRSPKAVLYPQRELHRHLTNVSASLVYIVPGGSNSLTIRAPRDEMGEVEKAVRQFDVPER